MLLSSRQYPPRLSLQRANTPSSLAATRALLAGSPLPSPGLPSILPCHGKKTPKINRTRTLRLLLWLTVCTLLFWAASRIVYTDQSSTAISYVSPESQPYQLVDDLLPDEPAPIVLTDQRGRPKWTISIPSTFDFPLKPAQYVSICDQSMGMSQHVGTMMKSPSGKTHAHQAHHPYYYADPHFMDIAEAETHNLLPGLSSIMVPKVEAPIAFDIPLKECDRSLTYALETSTAGLGSTLLSLWLAYGLAQSENRAFFIDDTNWPYGSYSTYLKPPPQPGCLPPPKTQIVPCPHQTRHLLVSAATTAHTFGHQFNEYFEDGRKMGVMRQDKIFAMMRAGYEALFVDKLNEEDQTYLNDRLADLNSTIRTTGGEEIGIHVRHGDQHPLEYQYQKSYIPLSKYLDTAHNLSTQTTHATNISSSQILIASDDPDVYLDPLITSSSSSSSSAAKIQKAQSHITLASRRSLASSGKTGPGWEGGFFKDVFWSLGLPSSATTTITDGKDPTMDVDADSDHNPHQHPSSSSLRLRELVGRAYLLDLAVLGQADRVVCAVSSYGCRILAVMMGWDRGIVQGGWLNVDGEFEWKGVGW